MKKYTRTKDGIYEPDGESFDKLDFLVKVKGGWNYLPKKEPIIKEADTVPELCDAFVVVTKNGEKHTYYSYEGYVLVMMECEEEGIKVEAYGAIWVKGDKGEPILRSVAKRKTTEGKEDLELL